MKYIHFKANHGLVDAFNGIVEHCDDEAASQVLWYIFDNEEDLISNIPDFSNSVLNPNVHSKVLITYIGKDTTGTWGNVQKSFGVIAKNFRTIEECVEYYKIFCLDYGKLVLIRGLPGSGKTTLAKEIAKELSDYDNVVHLENDMFHNAGGRYLFDGDNHRKAVEWCYTSTAMHLFKGDTVIVANTFTTPYEYEKYLALAEEYGITDVRIIRCVANYGSVHNVPEFVIDQMAKRMTDIEGEEIWR